MRKRRLSPAVGSLIYSDRHGPGIVTQIFIIRKDQPRMMTVLFGKSSTTHVYETEVKVLQHVERKADGSVSIVFDR